MDKCEIADAMLEETLLSQGLSAGPVVALLL
jgi:hypothetical protein